MRQPNAPPEKVEENHQQLEKTRLTSEEQYHALADAMPQIVWTAQPAGRLKYYNQRWFEATVELT